VTRRLFSLAVLFLSSGLAACGGGGGGGGSSSTTPPDTPAAPDPLVLESFDGGTFTIQKPTGWEVHVAGACTTLGFLIRDPNEPLRQIFYFGLIGPVYLSQAQKDCDADYMQKGGFKIDWADAPVIDPLTPENYFEHWPDIAAMKAATKYLAEFPELQGLEVISSEPASVLQGATSAQLRIVFKDGSRGGEGLLLGSVWTSMPQATPPVPAGGNAYGSFICGVTAPKSEFKYHEAKLVESLQSFTLADSFLPACQKASLIQWTAVQAAGQSLREASDIIFEGWQSRSQTADILAERGSDTMLGYERVYDPSTDHVYQVPAGWYDSYNTSRGNYDLSNLQILPSDSWSLWTSAYSGVDAIH
jgi:hypothetical protein